MKERTWVQIADMGQMKIRRMICHERQSEILYPEGGKMINDPKDNI